MIWIEEGCGGDRNYSTEKERLAQPRDRFGDEKMGAQLEVDESWSSDG